MTLDATLSMLLDEATPALRETLRDAVRRAYEIGFREALTSATRAGVMAPVPTPALATPTPATPAAAVLGVGGLLVGDPVSAQDPPLEVVDDDLEPIEAPAPRVDMSALEDDDEDDAEEHADDDEADVDDDGDDAANDDESCARTELMAKIERVVREGDGLAVSDVARVVDAALPRVSALLRRLKRDGRIHQGGERRFARYAADPGVAERAALRARGSTRVATVPRERASDGAAATSRALEVAPVRPNLTVGKLRARIVKHFGLDRFDIDVVVCRTGDATRRQLRADVPLRKYLHE